MTVVNQDLAFMVFAEECVYAIEPEEAQTVVACEDCGYEAVVCHGYTCDGWSSWAECGTCGGKTPLKKIDG